MLAYAAAYALKKKRKDAIVIADFNYFREDIKNRWGHILISQLKYVFISKKSIWLHLYIKMMNQSRGNKIIER